MERREFQKILADSLLNIVEVGIRKGYFKEEKREELNAKIIEIFKNGIEYDIPGSVVYGQYVPSQKKLYYNAKIFKNKQEALMYVLHEMKHGLDHSGDSIGFEQNEKNVGSNEGATQRFATDIAEEMLGEKISETTQTSLGIKLQTNLDEYQIEDKINELYCKVLEISRADFLLAQNEENKESFNTIINKFNEHANFEKFQQALDGIYAIQEETWVDENGELFEIEKEPTEEQTQRAKELIKICKNEIFKYVEKTNPSKLEEIKEEFIMPMNEYGEIVRNGTDNSTKNEGHTSELNIEPMNDLEILYQADYMKYQDFLMNGVDLGEDTIVFISGLGGSQFEKITENDIYLIIREMLENQNKQYTESLFLRSGDTYKVADITFDKNGTKEISNYRELDSLDRIIDNIEHSEVIGNEPEYIRILKLQGKDEEAQKIQAKYNDFLKNQDRIDEIREHFGEEKTEQAKEVEEMKEMEEFDLIHDIDEVDNIEKKDSDLYEIDRYGVFHELKEDSFKETAEDTRSIEARKQVLAELTKAQSNEKTQENLQEQGD